MKNSIYKTAFVIFWSTLILYLVTLVFAAYVGVYLTYVAIPVIVISGLFAFWFEPPKPTPVEKTPEERLREIEERLKYLEK